MTLVYNDAHLAYTFNWMWLGVVLVVIHVRVLSVCLHVVCATVILIRFMCMSYLCALFVLFSLYLVGRNSVVVLSM